MILEPLKFSVLLFSILLLFQGCKDDCEQQARFTPPTNFIFELVDKTTKENLFTNQTFSPIEMRAVNVDDSTAIDFDFIDEDDLNRIQIVGIGWETEKVNALLRVGDKDIANLRVDAERKSEDCCAFTEYNEIKIENADFQLNAETGVYTVFVD